MKEILFFFCSDKTVLRELQNIAFIFQNQELKLVYTFKGFKDTLSETTPGTPQRRSKKGKHHSLRENRGSMSISNSDEVFDGKGKKGELCVVCKTN